MSTHIYNKLREEVQLLTRFLGILDDKQTNCCNISISQCHALIEIERSQSISLIDLSTKLCLDKSTMSRTVNHLVHANLVQREIDADNRKYISISLTEEGKQVCNEINSTMIQMYQEILTLVPEAEQEQLLMGLRIFNEVLQKYDKQKT